MFTGFQLVPSQNVTSLISPLTGNTNSHVVAGLSIEEDGMLVSFDVSSLFTNVPIDEAVRIIRDKLQGDEILVDRTTLSPDRTA